MRFSRKQQNILFIVAILAVLLGVLTAFLFRLLAH